MHEVDEQVGQANRNLDQLAGLGFAVVADEVRNLAQRCAQAAKDTTSLIEESVQTAKAGEGRLDQVAVVIRSITASATRVKMLVDEVSHGGTEQARGIDQISRALVQMEATTQQAASNAEESASASQELRAQADSMQQIISSLEALVASTKQPVVRNGSTGYRPAPAESSIRLARPLTALAKAVGKNRSIPLPAATTRKAHAEQAMTEFSEF